MKKKMLCVLLALCLFVSFALTSYAILGPIEADDEVELVKPTLEVTDTPLNAVAVARNMINHTTSYYTISANITDLNPNATTFCQPGFVPESNSSNGGVVSPNNIIGDDEREIVYFTEEYPHRAIAYLVCDFSYVTEGGIIREVTGYGTATLISPDVAITSAHCIYHPEYGWPDSVIAYFGVYGNFQQVNGINTLGFVSEAIISVPHYEAPYTATGDKHDWALLRFEDPVGNHNGYLGYEYKTESAVTPDDTAWPIICGYPYDLNHMNGQNLTDQYIASERIIYDSSHDGGLPHVTIGANGREYPYRIYHHEIDATDGQSGSAIIVVDFLAATPYTIIGIHSRYENAVNKAVGIDSLLYSIMVAYTSE